MKLSNWREVPLFLWIIILFTLAIPLLINNSSSNLFVNQPSDAAAKSKKSNSIDTIVPESASPPSYIDQIINPTPPPQPTSNPGYPSGNMNQCRFYLYNSEGSSLGDCSNCRGAYLDDAGDMPVCMTP